MEIWKLTNIDRTSPNWKMSPSYQDVIIVRAENCDKARALAFGRYFKPRITPPAPAESLQNPWGDVNTVECVPIEDEQYDPKGPEEILFPEDGQTIGASIAASVEVRSVPKDYHVWVAVQKGRLVWPREPEVTVTDRPWSGIFYEGGRVGKVDLVLLLVPAAGHEQIQRWLERAKKTGSYPGMSQRALGATQLDTVKNLNFIK